MVPFAPPSARRCPEAHIHELDGARIQLLGRVALGLQALDQRGLDHRGRSNRGKTIGKPSENSHFLEKTPWFLAVFVQDVDV